MPLFGSTKAAAAVGAYDHLWSGINRCVVCTEDRRIDPGIRERWKAEAFLPYPGVGPEPPGLPVRYLLVAMEPSARPKRKKTREYMQKKIAEGSRNFKGDFHIRFAAHSWLVTKGTEGVVMTDLAKCMVRGKDAGPTASHRYTNCEPWFGREIELFRDTLRAIVPVGNAPHKWLRAFAQDSWPTITKPIVHPAMRFTKWKDGQANYDGLPNEDEFRKFAHWCDPTGTPRLGTRELRLLARWNVQFAEIRAKLDLLGR